MSDPHTPSGGAGALLARLAPARGGALRERRREGRRPSSGPEPAAEAEAATGATTQDAAAVASRSRASTSAASPCSTWATSRARTTPTGSTSCGRPSCRPSRTNTARTAATTPASARAASASRGFAPTGVGEIKTIFEFELFGTGVDAGQTTFRLRHAWGELGQIGAGQTWSPFMDPDVFPNSVEYWGPTGMVFFRNVQLRWTPWQDGDSRFAIALERPGASADQGDFAGRIELRGRPGPLPAARPLRAVQARAGLGPRPGRRHRPRDEVGRPQRRRVRPERRGHRLGHQPELEPQVHREEARGPAAVRVRRGRPELHERRAGGRRHRDPIRGSAHADHRRGPAPDRHRGLPRPELEREVRRAPSATR